VKRYKFSLVVAKYGSIKGVRAGATQQEIRLHETLVKITLKAKSIYIYIRGHFLKKGVAFFIFTTIFESQDKGGW